ncbi:Trypsin [Mycolicibacterium rutilum]|uniref:Trypsin n=1 Tax=Mycolicibacterium rutilum TaxID=370526 RepID=A0A1H6LD83_MYCRU|nr:trypsin-like serine protease [Mycolicibacterium rutilum]SEH83990.1 Trypsin [Mycolicibacterium rutilum]
MSFATAARTVTVSIAVAALTAGCQAPAARTTPVVASLSSAHQAAPDPAVGAVFTGTPWLHTCTASVLAPGNDGADGNLILTAAHCLTGVDDATFVAGYDEHSGDVDSWHLDAVYFDPRWTDDQDPHADFAIARVSRDGGPSLAQLAGGGLRLGAAPPPGAVVTVTGYETGVGGGPITCTASTAPATHGYPSLPCRGLADGLSGAPWVMGSTVTGLVGGLNGGGCDENTSYSPPFDDAVARLRDRAEAGGPADDPPTVYDDECG